jgi:hypothetical protein
MAYDDQHSSREKKIFSCFAKVSGLWIQPESIEKHQPPEPDILCTIEGEGTVAFEMVEIIDETLARRTYGQIKLHEIFKQAYEDLLPGNYTSFKEKFHNALIYVRFCSTASSRIRGNAIPMILDLLMETDTEFTGSLAPPHESPLSEAVKSINISRGEFTGPCFDVEAAGSFADPTIERLATKLTKNYRTLHPVELLAYYELQPVLPESTWVPRVQEYVRQNLPRSLFRRVWIFDIGTKAVMFMLPR